MKMIEGYEICKTILFETGHGIALGCVKDTPEKSAVWSFMETAYGRDYYQKSCHENRSVAEEVFRIRAGCYHELYGVREKTGHSTIRYYRCYSTQRPVDIGTFPKPEGSQPAVIINYDSDRRRPVTGGKLSAWGELVYPHPLTREQIENYELIPAPDNPQHSS